MLESTMMDWPLTIPSILERARTLFPHKEIVSVLPTGVSPETKQPIPAIHRTTYGQSYPRIMQLANALKNAGIQNGDRVATFALNHYRHFELYYAVPSVGAVCHMINIRLPPEQIIYIANHAEDKIVFVDNLFAAHIPALRQHCPKLQRIIVMGPVPGGLPEGCEDYEEFIGNQSTHFSYPSIDERQACGMCYTSGTTGNPKGVMYSHRAMVLHSLASMTTDLLGVNERDAVMAIVPMFHVNAWGFPYSCAMAGAKQIHLSAFSLVAPLMAKLIEDEKVTIVAGVPTIAMALLEELDKAKNAGTPYNTSSVRSLLIGGSAAPKPLVAAFETRHNMHVTHAWGMTETTPLGTVNKLRPEFDDLTGDDKHTKMALTGRVAPLIEIEIMNGDGQPLPHDGKTMGRLMVRGAWVTGHYFKTETGSRLEHADNAGGWFDTGDIATIDEHGYMLIQDRAKDLIKSGGEWISSVDLENTLMGFDAIKEAAVIALPHPKWDERPLGVIVLREGASTDKETLDAYLLTRGFAKWQLPDAYEFVTEIPKTTVGKFLKRALREQFKDYKLPSE